MNDILGSILGWFRKAIPLPEPRNQTTQLGVHIEEFAEMLRSLVPGTSDEYLLFLANDAHTVAGKMKAGEIEIDWNLVDRVEFLDSLCDQVVTATGTAYVHKMDILPAMMAVSASNWSKFDDNDEPIFDENRKIIKGPNYQKVELINFV